MRTPTEQDLGKLIVARTAQGQLVAVGRCVGYTDAPTVTVKQVDGSQVRWRADMCIVLGLADDVADAMIPKGC